MRVRPIFLIALFAVLGLATDFALRQVEDKTITFSKEKAQKIVETINAQNATIDELHKQLRDAKKMTGCI
jgi:hypothetical protein